MQSRTFSFLGALLCLASAASAQGSEPITSQEHRFTVHTFASPLEHPWGLAFLPDGSMLVTERPGRLRRISVDGELSAPLGGVPEVFAHRQGGLLDVAVHPDFARNGWIYLSFAAGDARAAGTEVARARLQGDALVDVEVIFRSLPKTPGGLHYGSRLCFAPDGTLLITLGERYSEMQQAQDPHTHLGTIVRIHDDGTIPLDNPYADGESGAPEVFTFGHRNVQGIALHPRTGAIWTHEHGPMGGDEINVLQGGSNYGWPIATYGRDYSGAIISDRTEVPGTVQPRWQWTPSIAPSGMAFYTAEVFPRWKGNLFVGSLKFMHVRRVVLEGDRVVGEEELLRDRRQRIRDVRVGPDGFLYILTDERSGAVLRLEPVG
jgi:aldose sugar dehydrogenase